MHQSLMFLLRQKNLTCHDGRVTYLITPHHAHYFITILMVMVLCIFQCIVLTIKQVIPITLFCTTYYTSFVEQLLILNKINYLKIFNPYKVDVRYYRVNKKKTLSMNPKLDHFIDQVIQLMPLTEDELNQLSQHTGLKNLNEAQIKVLSLLPDINAHCVVQQHYVDNEEYQHTYETIVSIKKVNDYYRIKTLNGIYDTAIIISDDIHPLHVGNVVSQSYYHQVDDCVIHDDRYIVNQQNRLEPLRKKLTHDNVVTLPFYSLNPPRQGLKMHPFHLPPSKDYFLSMMIVMQALIDLI